MPKLNAVLMVVLSLAVSAGAAWLALRGPGVDPDAGRIAKLIRQLGDDDPDLRREAARDLKQYGPRAEGALDEASRGDDARLAERAKELLARLRPDGPKTPESPATPSDPPALAGTYELSLQVVQRSPLRVYVRLFNGTKEAVHVAVTRGPEGVSLLDFGFFEDRGRDGWGRRIRVAPAVGAKELVRLEPGALLDTAPVDLQVAADENGPIAFRFVYEATEEGAYRALAASTRPRGALLPAGRLVSAEAPLR